MRDTTKVYRQFAGDADAFTDGGCYYNEAGQMRFFIGADELGEGTCLTDWLTWDSFNLEDESWIDAAAVESSLGMEPGSLAKLPQWEQIYTAAQYYGWREFSCDYEWCKWSEDEFNEWERFHA